MGIQNSFFKDQEYTKPVTDNELLAMYLDEVVPTRLVDNNKSLERIRDLKSEKLKFLEYKSDDITKKFYKIGNYFSGETYNSFHDGSEDEKPAMQKIWEGTFTGEEQTIEGNTFYYYEAQDIQNAGLLMNTDEVAVTFDGVQYTLQVVTILGSGAGFGASSPQLEDCPFVFNYGIDNEEEYIDIITKTAGPHTLKVEGAPSGDEPSELIILFNGRPSSGSSTNVGDFIQFELPAEDLAELLDYDYVTLSQEGQGMAKLSIHLGTVDGHQIAYAGGDAYPPTSLIDPPNMMVYYTEDDGSDTEVNTPKAYVLFERPSGVWQIPNIVVAVDPNDHKLQEKY